MNIIVRYLYTCILFLLAPIYLFKLLRTVNNKPSIGKRWTELFGYGTKITGKKPIWVHAVSVGEAKGSIGLIKRIHSLNPDTPILVTTTTPTGAEVITEALSDIVEHRYLPLDFPFCVNRFISQIMPQACLIMETELWPNLLNSLKQHHIPTYIVNARLSERSCLRYKKIKGLLSRSLSDVKLVLCQQQKDADRFHSLGIPQSKLKVTGSLKFDISIDSTYHIVGQQLRNEFGATRNIWIAASTHTGEDQQILSAHKTLLLTDPTAVLILAPRHPERFHDVEHLISREKFSFSIRSKKEPISNFTQVYLADTMGELMTLISSADICFMGGSLVGEKVGGHNFLEPAALAKPIISGPSYYNFYEIGQSLIKSGALTLVRSSSELSECLIKLFSQPNQIPQLGAAALSVIEKNRGSVERTIQYIYKSDSYEHNIE